MKVGMYDSTIGVEVENGGDYYEFSFMEAIAYTMSITHPEDRTSTIRSLQQSLTEAAESLQNWL